MGIAVQPPGGKGPTGFLIYRLLQVAACALTLAVLALLAPFAAAGLRRIPSIHSVAAGGVPNAARSALLRLVVASPADADACAAIAARAAAEPTAGGGGALAFAVAADARDAFEARLAGALVLPAVGCPSSAVSAVGDAVATCHVLAGVCGALAAAEFEFMAVVEPADAWRVDAGAVASAARSGLYWGPMASGNGVPQSYQAVWPRVLWPTMAAPFFVLGRDVAAALCAMRESGLPLKLFGPPPYWVGVALRTLEGLVYVDSVSGREVEAWPAARVPAPAATQRVRVDIVLVIPNPWPWAARRRAQFEAFLATQRRVRGAFTAKLIFVMGSETNGPSPEEAPEEASARAHPDVHFVSAPACPDVDESVPSRWDGQMFPPINSSATCKVLEGIAVASERFDFAYLARVDSDAYFRWDYFLRERARALPKTGLYLGSINRIQAVFDNLRGVFGSGRFFPFAAGQGWILSPDVARYLAGGYRRSPRLRTVGPEDAAIAFHLWPFSVIPMDSPDFHVTQSKGGKACTAQSLLVHYMTPALVRCANLQPPASVERSLSDPPHHTHTPFPSYTSTGNATITTSGPP
jgi:hypothetical protein